ncbi:ninjurin-A isoform X3 [Leptinotarsa decemlineata]|uniref:ninjurin-A isoform X3 n=1 Tax=Leptinotarsa decemlineata TaxID=7539 RepID=UPI000C2544DE|nr:ninjurin-1-like isoform X3 [Leptinotarsa decemlineata]
MSSLSNGKIIPTTHSRLEGDSNNWETTARPGVENVSFNHNNENFRIPRVKVTKLGNENESTNLIPSTLVDEKDVEHNDAILRPFSPSFDRSVPTSGFVFDNEIGSTLASTEIPDVNIYQHKKTLAQGMMDLALFSANANQLRYVLESFARHPFYYPSVILICLSLLLQIGIGVGLIWNATYNVKDEKEICIANKINNFTIIGIFLVTVINVFISAFGVANPA